MVRHGIHELRALAAMASTGAVPGYFSSATAGERKLGFVKWACAISCPFYLHLVSRQHGAVKKKKSTPLFRNVFRNLPPQIARVFTDPGVGGIVLRRTNATANQGKNAEAQRLPRSTAWNGRLTTPRAVIGRESPPPLRVSAALR